MNSFDLKPSKRGQKEGQRGLKRVKIFDSCLRVKPYYAFKPSSEAYLSFLRVVQKIFICMGQEGLKAPLEGLKCLCFGLSKENLDKKRFRSNQNPLVSFLFFRQ